MQTKDLGHPRSTPGLRYQVDFENERRWLSTKAVRALVQGYEPEHLVLARPGWW